MELSVPIRVFVVYIFLPFEFDLLRDDFYRRSSSISVSGFGFPRLKNDLFLARL
jgi:hypothetical protein